MRHLNIADWIISTALAVSLSASSVGQQEKPSFPQQTTSVEMQPQLADAKSVDAPKSVECSSHYNGKYPGGTCYVEIKRDNPSSPNAVTIPRNTSVIVRVTGTRGLETITFDEKTSRIERPDAFSTFVQSALDPLKSLVTKLVSRPGGNAMHEELRLEDDPLYKRQVAVQEKIDAVRTLVTSAAKDLACLSNYEQLTPDKQCDSMKPLDATTFSTVKAQAICDIQGGDGCATGALRAGVTSLPIATEQATAGQITVMMGNLAEGTTDIPEGKGNDYDILLSNEQRLQAEIKDLQDAQKVLLQGASILASLPASVDTEIIRKQEHDSSTAITVSATGQINKTPIQLGVVNITWQTSSTKVSTGILFSGLPNNSFTNAPQIVNGQPVLDSAGKVTTIVTETTTRPDNVFPLVMLNQRIKEWRECSRACALYASGGVGVSLANSSTEFAAGPSVQWGVILISGLVHVGRVQYLTNGVQVGQMLGSSPPALPTEKRWSVSGGIGISYIIPFK